jgi:hypothetical protein
MTLARRVAALETALPPTQLVLRWLDEAHTFGDLESYVRSLLDADSYESPLDRLHREAERSARASMRGKRGEVAEKAIRSVLRETVFRFELVMRINVTVHELLEKEALIDAALSAHVALLTSERRETRRLDATCAERFATLRDRLLSRVHELHAAQEARTVVEGRYLDGHPALFPDTVRAWEEQVRSTGALAAMACRLAELDGVPPPEPPDPEAVSAGVSELVADLVEPAKSMALEKLGEARQAMGVATAWLRVKIATPESISHLSGVGKSADGETAGAAVHDAIAPRQ